MQRHKKTLSRFLALGVLIGVLFMGLNPHQKERTATALRLDDSLEKAPVISDRKIEEWRNGTRPDRILM